MIRIAICGSAGRMGRRLVALAHEDPSLEITGAVEIAGCPALGEDAGELAGVGTISVPVTTDLAAAVAGADVVIGFTNSQEASLEQARVCADSGKPFVVGTTGFTDEQNAAFAKVVAPIPCVKATNFSVGITVLLGLVAEAAKLLGSSFDCEIIESHHTKKKDAPSGTAVSLAESVAKARGWKLGDVATHGREGLVGERPGEEIGMHAVRAGDIVGHHDVLFGGTGETLELVHRAQSRDTFVVGALRSAKWVAGRPAGLYTMRNVLGLE
jgi:4-hydroxy-tetrahydrodipicolinate reductase